MKQDTLYRHTRLYAVLKQISSFFHSIYYEEICVIGKERIPEGQPIIFTPNHQNALMDALAIIFSTNGQPLFMARADIFKKDLNRKLLNALKIIPVYRIRDGREAMSNNDSSFEIAFQVLKNNGMVGIMPEGNHGEQRRLRPLKKGFARLAIQTQELLKAGQPVKIVPVGLDYGSYKLLRDKLLVIYGNPIDVREYLDENKENPAKALQSLRARVAGEMKPLMLDIDSDTYYETIYDAKELYSRHKKSEWGTLFEKFNLEKQLIDKLLAVEKTNEGELSLLKQDLLELQDESKKLHLEPWIFGWNPDRPASEWAWDLSRAIVFFPVFIFAFCFHAVPFLISEYYAQKVKDRQFVSSMRFGVSFVLYLLWYLLFLCWPVSILIKLLFLICMPVLGVLAVDYWKSLKIMKVQFLYFWLKRQKNPLLDNLSGLYDRVIARITEISKA